MQCMGGHPKGLAEGAYVGFSLIKKNYRVISLILGLLMFSVNCLPAIENGDQNDMHRCRQVPIIY